MIGMRLTKALRPLLGRSGDGHGHEEERSSLVTEKRGASGLDHQQNPNRAIDLPLGFEKPRFY
jgi:hypothetical protein